MRARPALATVVVGLVAVSGTLVTAPGAGAADLTGPTERSVSDGKTTFSVVTNPKGGATLSYVPDGAVKLLREKTDSGELAFKDMNANGKLDAWEELAQAGRGTREVTGPGADDPADRGAHAVQLARARVR